MVEVGALFSMVLVENEASAFVVGDLVKASALVELETQSALVELETVDGGVGDPECIGGVGGVGALLELKELVHYWWSWRLWMVSNAEAVIGAPLLHAQARSWELKRISSESCLYLSTMNLRCVDVNLIFKLKMVVTVQFISAT